MSGARVKRPRTAAADIESALRDIRAGKMVVVVDDEDRENEGDFVMAAEKATAEDVNFMAREARGLICVSMTGGRLTALGLSLMAPINTARYSTPFTISVDLLRGTTSGSSAHDRALTIRALAAPRTKPPTRESSSGRGTRRRRSISCVSRDCRRRDSCARFSLPTGGWRAAGS